MTMPLAVPLVNVTGLIFGTDATPRTGRIIFSLQQLLQDSTDKITFPPYDAIAVLGSTNVIVSAGVVAPNPVGILAGQFSIVLVATDYANDAVFPNEATAVGTTWYYRTTYDLDNSPPYTYGYLIPHTPSPVDISQLSTVPVL